MNFSEDGTHENTEVEILKGIRNLKTQAENLIVVTNEIFSEAASYEGETEAFRKSLERSISVWE